MCYSAPASFVAGGLLSALGINELKKHRVAKIFALVPFLFGIQQLIEGLQWLSVPGSSFSLGLGYTFLLFAFVLWPIYIPLALFLTEKSRVRKKILRFLVGIGALISMSGALILLLNDLSVSHGAKHISYDIYIPLEIAAYFFYFLAVTIPFFVHSHHHFKIYGLVVLLSIFISLVFYVEFFISLWCFFGALLSVSVLYLCPREMISVRNRHH